MPDDDTPTGELVAAGQSDDGVHYQIRQVDPTYVILGKYEHACPEQMLAYRDIVEQRVYSDPVTPEMHANGWIGASTTDTVAKARDKANALKQEDMKREWFLSYSGVLLKAGGLME